MKERKWSRPYLALMGSVALGEPCVECNRPIEAGQSFRYTKGSDNTLPRGHLWRHADCKGEVKLKEERAMIDPDKVIGGRDAPKPATPPPATPEFNALEAYAAAQFEIWMTAHCAIELAIIIEDMRGDAKVLHDRGYSDIAQDQLDTAARLTELVIKARRRA